MEIKLWSLIISIGCCLDLSNICNAFRENLCFVEKNQCAFLYFYIYTYILIPFYYSSKERASSDLSFIFYTYLTYTSYFSSHFKKHYFQKKKKILRKFHKNFHTSESHENCYNEVFGHAEHESGLIFLITIISNCISALLA